MLTENGTKHVLEGADEKEILAAETALLKQTFTESDNDDDQPRDNSGRFISEEQAAARAELSLQFRRGEIDAPEFIQKSGALDEYLASKGVSIEALQEVSDKQNELSWASAVETFRDAHPEWIGGEQNRDIIGTIVQEQGWTNTPDKLEALEAAYQYARENNLLVSNPEVELNKAISEARSPAEIRDALIAHRGGNSGLFNT